MSAAEPFSEQRALQVIADNSPVVLLRGVTVDTLLSELGLDPIQFVTVCIALEDAFNITIHAGFLCIAHTAGDLVRITAHAARSGFTTMESTTP